VEQLIEVDIGFPLGDEAALLRREEFTQSNREEGGGQEDSEKRATHVGAWCGRLE